MLNRSTGGVGMGSTGGEDLPGHWPFQSVSMHETRILAAGRVRAHNGGVIPLGASLIVQHGWAEAEFWWLVVWVCTGREILP